MRIISTSVGLLFMTYLNDDAPEGAPSRIDYQPDGRTNLRVISPDAS